MEDLLKLELNVTILINSMKLDWYNRANLTEGVSADTMDMCSVVGYLCHWYLKLKKYAHQSGVHVNVNEGEALKVRVFS